MEVEILDEIRTILMDLNRFLEGCGDGGVWEGGRDEARMSRKVFGGRVE